MSKLIDLTGKRYDRLSVIERVADSKSGKTRYRVKCKCGNFRVVAGCDLKSGHTKSCGCLARELTAKRSTTHGLSYIPEYHVWWDMIRRVFDPTYPQFADYGGRGIDIDPDWVGPNGLQNFIQDMGRRPTPKHTIERVNNDKGYWKINNKWATRKEQRANQRTRKDYINQRLFKATSILGREYISNNQNKFARDHNLILASINKCLHNKQQIHKGWTFVYMNTYKFNRSQAQQNRRQ